MQKVNYHNFDFVSALSLAMSRQEGLNPGSRSYRNKNPGNLWDGLCEGKIHRIWPLLPIDQDGFLILSTFSQGYKMMQEQLKIKIARGETLAQLVAEWANRVGDNQQSYAANVAEWLGVDADVPLIEVQKSWTHSETNMDIAAAALGPAGAQGAKPKIS